MSQAIFPPKVHQEPTTSDDRFQQYRRTTIAEMRPYEEGEDLTGVHVGDHDRSAGSPRVGDMIGRNPANHDDKWLVAQAYFEQNFERV